jgi:peptidoglycan/LPS O-acetylase OafA/YrhL
MLLAFAHRAFRLQPVNRALLIVASLCIASLSSRYIGALAALIFLMTAEIDGAEPLVKGRTDYLHACWAIRSLGSWPICPTLFTLVHGFFISFVGGWLYRHPGWQNWKRGALLIGITLAGSYSVAYILHHLAEKRGIKLGQKMIKGLGEPKSVGI